MEMSRELCVVVANRGFGDGDTEGAKKIQIFRKDFVCNQLFFTCYLGVLDS